MLSFTFNIPFPFSLGKVLHWVWQFSHAGSHESGGCGCPRYLLPVAHTHVKFPLAFCSHSHPHCKHKRQLHPALKTALFDSLSCKMNAWAQLCCHKAEGSLCCPLRESILTSPSAKEESHLKWQPFLISEGHRMQARAFADLVGQSQLLKWNIRRKINCLSSIETEFSTLLL